MNMQRSILHIYYLFALTTYVYRSSAFKKLFIGQSLTRIDSLLLRLLFTFPFQVIERILQKTLVLLIKTK